MRTRACRSRVTSPSCSASRSCSRDTSTRVRGSTAPYSTPDAECRTSSSSRGSATAASQLDRFERELDIARSLGRNRRLPRGCKSRHRARAQRRRAVAQSSERLLEHRDEHRIDPTHQEHSAVGERGTREQRRITELACELGRFDAQLAACGIAAADLRIPEREQHATAQRTLQAARRDRRTSAFEQCHRILERKHGGRLMCSEDGLIDRCGRDIRASLEQMVRNFRERRAGRSESPRRIAMQLVTARAR